jgi:hypothetical protein
VDSITFVGKDGTFAIQSADSIKMLHYRSISSSAVADISIISAMQNTYDSTAQIIITYGEVEQSRVKLSRTIIRREMIDLLPWPVLFY